MREEIRERIELIQKGEVPEGYKNTEVGIFPYNWDELKLSQLLRFQNGINADKEKFGNGVKIVSVMDVLNQNPITYENIRGMIDIDEEMLERYSVSYGDVLFQRSSENIEDAGKSNIYMDDKNIATFGGFVIRGKKIADYNPIIFNEILKRQYVRKQIKKLAAGVQHINISQESLKEVSVVIPNEGSQKYIENIINMYQKLEKLQKTLIRQKLLYKKWLTLNLLTGKKRISKYTEEWKKIKICEVLEEGSKEKVLDTTKYRKITIKLNFGGLEFLNSKREMSDTRPFYIRRKNEIIIGKQNYFNGSIAMISEEFDGSICSNAIMSFLVKEKYCDKYFLLYYLSQPNFINKKSCMANGTGQKELSEKDFLDFEVKIPSVLEQQKIAKLLLKADKEIELLEKKLEQIKFEKDTMMQLLLTGIVRVK